MKEFKFTIDGKQYNAAVNELEDNFAEVTATIMIVAGIDNTNAITIALSCVSNVGPTLGTQIGPVMSWSMLPDYIKWILCPLMLMGRLEIMTVLVLFTRSYWKEN